MAKILKKVLVQVKDDKIVITKKFNRGITTRIIKQIK